MNEYTEYIREAAPSLPVASIDVLATVLAAIWAATDQEKLAALQETVSYMRAMLSSLETVSYDEFDNLREVFGTAFITREVEIRNA